MDIAEISHGPEIPDAEVPAIYRIRLNMEEQLAGVCFNPNEIHLPSVFFAPLWAQGQIVTPAYWDNHWPLARGKSTGGKVVTISFNAGEAWVNPVAGVAGRSDALATHPHW